MITAKPLTIADPTITKSKEYDKTVTANVTAGTLSGLVTVGSVTDVVTASAVATYNTSSVGTSKTITVVYTLSGADKDNYIKPVDKVYTDGVITAKKIIVKAFASNKPYDGNKNATVTLSSDGLIGGDLIILSKILAEFDSPEVGVNKLVTVSGISIGGADAGNYILTSNTVTTNASITPLSVIIFEVPNAFTPNGDGLNDVLKIISNAGIAELRSFKIYSRSGNLVFESRDLSRGWDGRFNNNLLPADIYYWTAVYVDRNNVTSPKTGTVLLLK